MKIMAYMIHGAAASASILGEESVCGVLGLQGTKVTHCCTRCGIAGILAASVVEQGYIPAVCHACAFSGKYSYSSADE